MQKDLVCPERIHSLGENGEGKLRRNPGNPGSLATWTLNRCVCATTTNNHPSYYQNSWL